MRVVVLQPMFLPWIGQFEQIRLADVYVHHDDVQYARRSLMKRVQVKSIDGSQWLTVPILKPGRNAICDVVIDEERDWRRKHLETLRLSYAKAPYRDEMLDMVQQVYSLATDRLCAMNIFAIEAIAEYFGLSTDFRVSSEFGIEGERSSRLLDLVRKCGGDTYLTGHGAADYLDHDLFEREGVRVEYMDYARQPYPQLHGAFDPHVTILDLIANCGRDGREVMCSTTLSWKDHVNQEPRG